jgi:hypothetical protein
MGDQQTSDARRMTKLSWDQVIAFRLERQFLRSRAPAGSLFEVASALCGVCAQLPLTAELALWARIDGLASVCQPAADESPHAGGHFIRRRGTARRSAAEHLAASRARIVLICLGVAVVVIGLRQRQRRGGNA